ncbi:MAG: metal-dependent transcriptional regulator [Haloarculaceae archaeon]
MPDPIDIESPVSPGEGRYLCGLLYLTLRDGAPVGNGDLADLLDVSGPTVTEMSKAFSERGLVSHELYVGAELTDCGERVAREILWRRCVVKEFFEATADVSLSDEEAYRIGLVVPDSDLDHLSELVEQPCHDHCVATDADECLLA